MMSAQAAAKLRHPLLEDFLQQNPSCDEDAAERAFLVYQDLTEVRGWWFTELGYSDDLSRPYVTGKVSRRLPQQVVLPVNVDERISLHDVQRFFCRLLDNGKPIKSITLAANELDSTLVYYKMTSGLSPPDPPEVTAQHKQDKNHHFDRKRRFVASCVQQALAEAEAREHERDFNEEEPIEL